MRIHELIEARSHSEQNPRIPINQRVKQYQQASERFADIPTTNAFVSFTDLEKLGVNPNSEYDTTPLGIYAYNIDYVIDTVGDDQPMTELPFGGDRPWANLFRVRGNIIDLKTVDDSDFYRLSDQARAVYIDHMTGDRMTAYRDFDDINDSALEHARVHSAGGELWYVINQASHRLATDQLSRWHGRNHVLVWTQLWRAMGVDGCLDRGQGIIYPDEPTQAVFFTRSVLTDIERVPNRYSPNQQQQGQRKGQVIKAIRGSNLAPEQRRWLNQQDYLVHTLNYNQEQLAGTVKFSNDANQIEFVTRWQKKIPEPTLVEIIEDSPDLIKFIKQPSEAVQLAAINSNSRLFRLIKQPSELVKLRAVQYRPENIKYIGAPSQQLQTQAVTRDPTVIKYIKQPTAQTIYLANQL